MIYNGKLDIRLVTDLSDFARDIPITHELTEALRAALVLQSDHTNIYIVEEYIKSVEAIKVEAKLRSDNEGESGETENFPF